MSLIQKSNSWGNRVVHADIRVNSIDDGDKDDDGVSVEGSQYSRGVSADEEELRTSEMQLWWDEAIARNMNLPEGYQHVSVLIIKWADELDELKTRAEAFELEQVFREKFLFKTQIVELNVSTKPQHQLNSHLTSFVEKNDGSHNLLIVYYTGHGVWKDDKYLELSASTTPSVKRGFKNDARCNWSRAEKVLRSDDTDGNVLTILDTCFSSNMVKSGKEDTRIYELLSACVPNSTTASPGNNSFTRALIDALNDLLVRYKGGGFTTFRLNEIINQNPVRQEMQSQLWNRLQHHERHIRLAPLKAKLEEEEGEAALLHRPRSYLTLRFALRHSLLSQTQIEEMTKVLAQSFSNKTLVRGIDWLTFKPARTTHLKPTALAIIVLKKWRRFVKRRTEGRLKTVDDVSMADAPSEPGTSTSPLRKRTRDGNEEYPESKRGSLGLSQRPLTPASDAA